MRRPINPSPSWYIYNPWKDLTTLGVGRGLIGDQLARLGIQFLV